MAVFFTIPHLCYIEPSKGREDHVDTSAVLPSSLSLHRLVIAPNPRFRMGILVAFEDLLKKRGSFWLLHLSDKVLKSHC